MKELYFKIDTCADCPYCYEEHNGGMAGSQCSYIRCRKDIELRSGGDRIIESDWDGPMIKWYTSIPNWCPLENKK